MLKFNFTILGSSAGHPQPGRCNSGYVLDVAGRLIQFDCGGGISRAFRTAGFEPGRVDSIVISHTHPDHVADLPLFVQMLYLDGRTDDLDIHIPGEVIEAYRVYFRALYLLPEKLPFAYRFKAIPEDSAVDLDGISVIPIRNRHLQGYADVIANHNLTNKMQCYSYIIEAEGKRLLYSADLGSDDDIAGHLDNIDVLVVESTHIDVGRLMERAVDAKVSQIVLTHITESFDTKSVLATAAKLGANNVRIAEDGMRIEL